MKHKKMKHRNSSIELLRLLAMFMIVFNHVRWPADQIISSDMPYLTRVALMGLVSFLSSFGGVGDCLFFGITAWFLCMENPSFKKSVLRAWMLERQLLFYAFVMFAFDIFAWLKLDILDFTPSNFIQTLVGTVFPFITSHWWYPTSYILFLLIFPWLTEGLRQFGKKKHGLLVLLLCSLQGIFPWSIIRLNIDYNITLFVYLYVLLSFFRWYTPEILVNTNVARILISIGFLFGVFTVIGIQILKPNAQNRVWLNCPSCFPSLFIAFGLLVYANKNNQFYSRIINKLASATLGVYLILTSEGVADGLSYLQHEILDGTGLLRICIISLSAVIFFCFGLCFDLVRQLIFSAFFDGNKGRVFLKVWDVFTNSTLVMKVVKYLEE